MWPRLTPDFDIHQPGFRVSDVFMQQWLAPVVQTDGVTDARVFHREAIAEMHERLQRMAGPDIALSLPPEFVRSVARHAMVKKARELSREGFTVIESSIEISLGDQALHAVFLFQYQKDWLAVKGRAEGSAFFSYQESVPVFRTFLNSVEITSVSIADAPSLNVRDVAGSLGLLARQVLPAVNASLQTVEIKFQQPESYEIDFDALASKVDGLSIEPKSLSVPPPNVSQPVLLITKDRVGVLADLSAEYLAKFEVRGKNIADSAHGISRFDRYRTDFERTWRERFSSPLDGGGLRAEVLGSRVAEVLEGVWKEANLQISFRRSWPVNTPWTDVGAFPESPDCGECSTSKKCDWISSKWGWWGAAELFCKLVVKTTCFTINVPLTVCTEAARHVNTVLRKFDFDKFAEVSTNAKVDVALELDGSPPVKFDNALRAIEWSPRISGNVRVDAHC